MACKRCFFIATDAGNLALLTNQMALVTPAGFLWVGQRETGEWITVIHDGDRATCIEANWSTSVMPLTDERIPEKARRAIAFVKDHGSMNMFG